MNDSGGVLSSLTVILDVNEIKKRRLKSDGQKNVLYNVEILYNCKTVLLIFLMIIQQ